MNLSRNELARLEAQMQMLKDQGVPFAMATVVRTVNATSASPGGKALLDRDGTILMGWVGGGCARGAIGKAARAAIASGTPQFVSLRPQELLDTEGLEAGEIREGVIYARNGCPSKGTMDVFVEPVLPLPKLVIFGAGLVAMALADLSGRFDFHRTLVVPEPDQIDPVSADQIQSPSQFATRNHGADFLVIATQGNGDLEALRLAASGDAPYVSFVGSSRKFAALATRLVGEQEGLSHRLDRISAPAGLHINAITPEEIALSVLSQITQIRRARDGFASVSCS
jgi:xanthine dehydrogenase accessory factor